MIDQSSWHNAVEAYKQASVSVNAWMVSYPELAPTLSQMLKWLPSPNVQQQIVSNSIESTDEWTSHVLEFLDKLLVAVQNLEKALPATQPDENESAWLLRDECQLESAWRALNIEQGTGHLEHLLAQLQHAAQKDESALAALSAVCKSVFPLLHAFSPLL